MPWKDFSKRNRRLLRINIFVLYTYITFGEWSRTIFKKLDLDTFRIKHFCYLAKILIYTTETLEEEVSIVALTFLDLESKPFS